MGINKYQPHVVIIPEDDANRQIALGFYMHPLSKNQCIDIRMDYRGWKNVIDVLQDKDTVNKMRKFVNRYMVLLIDFDGKVDERIEEFRQNCPFDIKDRVFILGSLNEPEDLRRDSGKNFEDLGYAFADECITRSAVLWNHPLWIHNGAERGRLNIKARDIVF